jgi:transposase
VWTLWFTLLDNDQEIKEGTIMSTSLLYHGFSIVGYRYLSTLFENGAIFFKIKQEREKLRCPVCNKRNVIAKGKTRRKFRSLPIGKKATWIDFDVPRVKCLTCGIVRQVKIRFADFRRTYTRAFERYALDLSRHMTIRDVARHLNISWDVVKDIQKRHLKKRFERPRLKDLRRIAIDEISVGKGHRYLTIVLNLDSGAVVFVGHGKDADSLSPFWKRLKYSRAKIKAVAIDMSPAYIAAALENLPDAAIVFDRFHIMKMYNDKLSGLRRKLQREAENPLQMEVLKGTRWLLLKNRENLSPDPKKREKERLQEALKLNEPLAKAYYLKDELRQFWEQSSKAVAEKWLEQWIQTARQTNIPMLIKMANSLEGHRYGLLNWYDYPISTGPLEGTNNKIKTMQRQAYGFRDHEFFKLKIFALHKSRYALVG